MEALKINREKEINKEKEISPNEYAIKIEEGVLEDYISSAKEKPENKERDLTDLKIKWITNHAIDYRIFFDANSQEIIELYKKDPKQAIEYIKSGIEKNENNNNDRENKEINKKDIAA
jgi:hypothetical protein